MKPDNPQLTEYLALGKIVAAFEKHAEEFRCKMDALWSDLTNEDYAWLSGRGNLSKRKKKGEEEE